MSTSQGYQSRPRSASGAVALTPLRFYNEDMREARILAVDDEPMNVEILARYLQSKGHRVAGAADAEEALAALRAGSFDLVLVDVVLPGRTGLEVLPELAQLTQAPIHIMSGSNDDDTRRDALMLGAAGFLPKPIDLEALTTLVADLPDSV